MRRKNNQGWWLLESFTAYKIKRIKIILIESIDYTFGSVQKWLYKVSTKKFSN